MEELLDKYIDLILKRCINFNQTNSLLVHIDLKEHLPIAEKVKQKANQMGIFDVCINLNDLDDTHDYLQKTNIEDIEINSFLDKSNWDKYAKKGAPVLRMVSEVPGLMDDIPSDKIQKWFDESEKTIKYYRTHQGLYTFPWCIVELPNERWAKTIFGDTKDAYDKLFLSIMKMCMIDNEDPIFEWENYIEKNNYYKNRLNELGIKKMHYINSLGTDLIVGIPEDNKWLNLDKKDASGGIMIANMPSYEVFTSPDRMKTNGIVYSCKPLLYNNQKIEDFSITFKDGKAISCQAKKGQEALEQLLFNNENAGYLGEVALVPYDSPISNTGLIFNTTLFDENASCHLALGRGFPKAFKDYEKFSDEELLEKGLNYSSVHVDFMIGTEDLMIEADTKEGKKLIFKNGNFNI